MAQLSENKQDNPVSSRTWPRLFKFNKGRDKGSSYKYHIRTMSGEMTQEIYTSARRWLSKQ